jgi:signal transduction histidine kinase
VASAASLRDECRRVGELLKLDAVGVAAAVGTTSASTRRVTWWTALDSPPLPPRLEDILGGRIDGWLVYPMPDGTVVFGRTTPESEDGAATLLEALAPSMSALAERMAGADPRPSRTLETPHADAPGRAEPERLIDSITAVRQELGCETASLYDLDPVEGWKLMLRIGKDRPWHHVLDPQTLGPLDEPMLIPDVRTFPGIGPRLAALGCGAVGVLALPGGGRLVLDSAAGPDKVNWIERARPVLSALAVAAADLARTRGPSLSPNEAAAIRRAAVAARRALDPPAKGPSELLGAVANAIGATDLFYLVMVGNEVEVSSSRADEWPRQIPPEIRSSLRRLGPDLPLDEATTRQLGVVLGARGSTLSAVPAETLGTPEALLSGWRVGPRPSDGALRLVAQVVGGAIVALDSRRKAVDALMVSERSRWAYEIHDGLTQAVTTAVLELESLTRRIERDPREAIEALDATKAQIRSSLAELRDLLFELSDDEGERAKRPRQEPLARYVEDVVQRWRLPATVSIDGDLARVPRPLLGAAYVVIREALANAAKHASARRVTVTVRARPQELLVEVGDSGRGIEPPASDTEEESRRHFGLEMMRRRVGEVGGTLDISSRPGKGTRVIARLPMAKGE